jgi:DNA-binding GntR family transcriptional regulator
MSPQYKKVKNAPKVETEEEATAVLLKVLPQYVLIHFSIVRLADISIMIVHSSSVSKDLLKTRLHHPANQNPSPSPLSKTLILQHTTYGSSLPPRSQPTSDQQPWSPSCSQVSCSRFGLQSCDRVLVI